MAIVFAWRAADGFNARYSRGGSLGITASATSINTAADVGAIGGQAVTCPGNNNIKYISWPGRGNVPANTTISVLARIAHHFNGTPPVTRNLFTLMSGGNRGPIFEGEYTSGSAALVMFVRNETCGGCISASSGIYSATSASYTDFYFSFNGQTGASAGVVYVNATLNGVCNSTGSMVAGGWENRINEIVMGTGALNGIISTDRLSELVIWDQTVDVTAIRLADGTTASLNGPTRTSFVDVVALDGAAWTTLAQTNVRNTIVYTAAGVVFTGSVVTAAAVVGSGGVASTLGWPTFT